MISASKSTLSLNNLKILRPKVTKILQICLRSFVNPDPGAQRLFCQQYYSQLYQYAQLEVTSNFYQLYALRTLCASENIVNLLMKNLLIEC